MCGWVERLGGTLRYEKVERLEGTLRILHFVYNLKYKLIKKDIGILFDELIELVKLN
jgi:hypothetical protein